MKLNDVKRFSVYVRTIYHSVYITKAVNEDFCNVMFTVSMMKNVPTYFHKPIRCL